MSGKTLLQLLDHYGMGLAEPTFYPQRWWTGHKFATEIEAKAIAEGWYQTTVFNPSNTTGTVYSDHDSW